MTLDSWAANGGSATAAERAAYVAAWSQDGALSGGLNYYRASPLYPAQPGAEPDEARLQVDGDAFRVRVPTLVLWGERDEALLPGNLDGLDRYAEKLTVQRVPDASHWIVHERPTVVNAAIEAFIR